MPNPKNKVKATGDTHLPEVESDEFDLQESHPEGAGTAGSQARERRAGGEGAAARGGNKGGMLKDRDLKARPE